MTSFLLQDTPLDTLIHLLLFLAGLITFRLFISYLSLRNVLINFIRPSENEMLNIQTMFC